MRPFIMNLVKAVPKKKSGQDGFLMYYDLPTVQMPQLDGNGLAVVASDGTVQMVDVTPSIENPQWIPKANMEMLQTVSPDDAKEVIAAALAAGATS